MHSLIILLHTNTLKFKLRKTMASKKYKQNHRCFCHTQTPLPMHCSQLHHPRERKHVAVLTSRIKKQTNWNAFSTFSEIQINIKKQLMAWPLEKRSTSIMQELSFEARQLIATASALSRQKMCTVHTPTQLSWLITKDCASKPAL